MDILTTHEGRSQIQEGLANTKQTQLCFYRFFLSHFACLDIFVLLVFCLFILISVFVVFGLCI